MASSSSFYSDFGSSFYPQTQLENQVFACYDSDFTISDNNSSSLSELDELLYYSSDSYTNLLPYLSSSPSDTEISLSPDIFPPQAQLEDLYDHRYDNLYYPKRHKSLLEHCNSFISPSFFDGSYVSNSFLLPEIQTAAVAAPVSVELPKFEAPASVSFSVGRSDSDESNVKKASVSAQSIAARDRRRKITEKTQELGKLIPGGTKMNTAEMLQSAYKYVKFLQAQLKVLQHMDSIHQEKEELGKNELQTLLASSTVEEKLYSKEKCLVPRNYLETIANDQELMQSTPLIMDEIEKILLVGTDG